MGTQAGGQGLGGEQAGSGNRGGGGGKNASAGTGHGVPSKSRRGTYGRGASAGTGHGVPSHSAPGTYGRTTTGHGEVGLPGGQGYGESGGRDNIPLVRLAPSQRLARHWRAPDYIPGIEHIVEGYGFDQYEQYYDESSLNPLTPGGQRNVQRTGNISKYNKEQKKAYEAYTAEYKGKQAERALIPSLPDPDSLSEDALRRKSEARKRMRGMLGTIKFDKGPSARIQPLGGSPTNEAATTG